MSTESLPVRAESQALLTERVQWWSESLLRISPEELAQCGNQAITELDGLWPYMGEECIVSGPAVYPEMAIDEENGERSLSIQAGHVSELHAKSEGFTIANMVPDERPRLWYAFYMGDLVMMPHPTACNIMQLRAYLDPMQASILPISVVEETLLPPIPEIPAEELFSKIDGYSEVLKAALRSTGFRRLRHQEQKRFVDRLIEDCEATTGLRELPILAEAQYCYRFGVKEDVLGVEAVHIAEQLIGGTCRGWAALNS